MDKAEDIFPLPFVNLDEIGSPKHGKFLPTNDFCQKKFKVGGTCKQHYESLKSLSLKNKNPIVECPYGFSSLICVTEDGNYAMTGFIPFPRHGSIKERELAKRYPKLKIDSSTALTWAETVKSIVRSIGQARAKAWSEYPSALHEIRKYNRTIKQQAEKICKSQSPSDLDQADPQIVLILKTSELMSQQFDIIDLIANESLVTLKLNTRSELNKLFEKCAIIHKTLAQQNNLILNVRTAPVAVKVNDKTFPIIPTVLLENAIKYAQRGTEIRCRLDRISDKQCKIAISNIAPMAGPNINNIFLKGVRASRNSEGEGIGLYLAQLVAKQHASEIILERKSIGYDGKNELFTFSLILDTCN